MNKLEFESVLTNIKSGTPFTATVAQDGEWRQLSGKVHINSHHFWLCYNEGISGSTSPEMYGYKRSWIVEKVNIEDIQSISFESVVINQYEIF